MIRILFVCALLAGCAAKPLPLVENTEGFNGRLSITQADRRDSGGFAYTQQSEIQQWDFFGPTGGPLGRLTLGSRESAWVPSKGEILTAADPSALTDQALGVALPIEQLGPWVLTGASKPLQIQQWTLETRKRDAAGRPRIIEMNSPEIRVRAVIKAWQPNLD